MDCAAERECEGISLKKKTFQFQLHPFSKLFLGNMQFKFLNPNKLFSNSLHQTDAAVPPLPQWQQYLLIIFDDYVQVTKCFQCRT